MDCTFEEFSKVINSIPSNIKVDLNHYLLMNNFFDDYCFVCDLFYDKYSNPIFFLCNLKNKDKVYLKHFFIHGFFGGYLYNNDFFQMELSLKLNSRSIAIEIVKIHVGLEKRVGRGTVGLKFLEQSIIPYLNNILKESIDNSKIDYIYGISADLSDDTDSLSRSKFYYKNEFELINNHFYKYL